MDLAAAGKVPPDRAFLAARVPTRPSIRIDTEAIIWDLSSEPSILCQAASVNSTFSPGQRIRDADPHLPAADPAHAKARYRFADEPPG